MTWVGIHPHPWPRIGYGAGSLPPRERGIVGSSQKGTLTLDSGKNLTVGFLMCVLDDDEVTLGAGVGLWGAPSTRPGLRLSVESCSTLCLWSARSPTDLVTPLAGCCRGDPCLPRKEVIQPHLPVQLPCYDLVPVTSPTLGACLLAVSPATSSVTDFHDLTGGVYKTRERIHRSVLTCGY